QLLSRGYMNLYNFDDYLAYLPRDGGPEQDTFRGLWGGIEQRVVYTPTNKWRITVGGEIQRHFRAFQLGSTDTDQLINRADPFTAGAGYANADFTPVRVFKVSAGARFDTYSNSGSALSPRLAFIIKPYDAGNIKIIAGRAFSAPSVYELFFRSATQIRPD